MLIVFNTILPSQNRSLLRYRTAAMLTWMAWISTAPLVIKNSSLPVTGTVSLLFLFFTWLFIGCNSGTVVVQFRLSLCHVATFTCKRNLCNLYLSRLFTTIATNLAIWLANLPLSIRVQKTLLAWMSRHAFFSSRFEKEKNIFFDADIVVKNKSNMV